MTLPAKWFDFPRRSQTINLMRFAAILLVIAASQTVAGAEPLSSTDHAAVGAHVAQRGSDMATPSHLAGLVTNLTIFVLAIFVGFEVITKVPTTLHTPLMSGSNAISGITLIGALVAAGSNENRLATLLATLAVALATINVVGGFLVTHRMLGMFNTKKTQK